MIEEDFSQFKGGGFDDFPGEYLENVVIELPKNKFKILQKYRIRIDFSQFN